MGPKSSSVIFFRVGVPITNIIIGPLLINRKGYHKNETCSRNHCEFQYEVSFKFCDCSRMKKKNYKPISRLARQTVIITQILIYALFHWISNKQERKHMQRGMPFRRGSQDYCSYFSLLASHWLVGWTNHRKETNKNGQTKNNSVFVLISYFGIFQSVLNSS